MTGVRQNSSFVFSGLVGEAMRRAFRSIFSGDFGASAGFPRWRGYISSAARGAPPSVPNLPEKIESHREVGAEMRVADAIAPADPARYHPHYKGGAGFTSTILLDIYAGVYTTTQNVGLFGRSKKFVLHPCAVFSTLTFKTQTFKIDMGPIKLDDIQVNTKDREESAHEQTGLQGFT